MDILGPFPLAQGQMKFSIVTVNYFAKWIKVKALAKITATNLQKFFKIIILARCRIPQFVVTNNEMQFTYDNLNKLFKDLNVKRHFTLAEQLLTNGQVELVNRVLLRGLKRRVERFKGNWEDELLHVL